MKNWLIAIVVAVLAGFLVEFLFNPANIISVLIGLLAGAVVVVVLLAQSRGENPREVAVEVIRQAINPDPGAEERVIHEQLYRLNERLRFDGNLFLDFISKAEQLIDLLRKTVPQAQEKMPSSETTFDLVRLATTHLPKLFGDYLGLSLLDREAKKRDLMRQISDLLEHVQKVQENLDNGQRNEYEAQSNFLRMKF